MTMCKNYGKCLTEDNSCHARNQGEFICTSPEPKEND